MSVVTLCSADCIHNSGYGYYCVCNHPAKQDRVPYSGIDRYYVEGCPLKEVIEVEGTHPTDQARTVR